MSPRKPWTSFIDDVGAVGRGALGQADLDEERALVLARQEARRHPVGEPSGRDEGRGQQREADDRAARDGAGDPRVAVARAVDAPRDPAHDAAGRPVMRLEHDRAERGAQRQRVDRRDHHRDGDRDGELLEELARDAGDEGDRHEDRQQHQRDRDDCAGDLAHRDPRRVGRAHAGVLGHHALDVLDDDDRVVDDDADREDQREQRDGVQREAEREHDSRRRRSARPGPR